MGKKPLIVKWLAIVIILLFVCIAISSGIPAGKDYITTKIGSENTLLKFRVVGIDKIDLVWIDYSYHNWVIFIKIKNDGDTVERTEITGEMFRILRPNHIVDRVGLWTHWSNDWKNGEIKSIALFAYDPFESLIPGIYHIDLRIKDPYSKPTTVMNNNYFIFWNRIFPKIRLRY